MAFEAQSSFNFCLRLRARGGRSLNLHFGDAICKTPARGDKTNSTRGEKRRGALIHAQDAAVLKTGVVRYSEYSARTAPYDVWPDARLRAYLREHSLSEDALPTSRPGLLQEVRIRYVQTTGRAEALFGHVKAVFNGGVEAEEDRFGKVRFLSLTYVGEAILTSWWRNQVLDVLTGSAEHARERTGEGMQEGGQKLKDAGAKVSKNEL
ncbi:hypothetical protein POSPLADRAFT_1049620 [Postia placenta MAD-698-R-SB12]|uniref:Uncharacterized protein n=1 Tax=Postia placenta MAD-698-R-SB12 TaxID=670580 RepID=A0A1X6MN99_9APHY|nr:hypothetical protein POSPLADRAFT_1049620 [Postia placenta MAD-698-R-SB12]OSX57855.1 hypothetical protein POSPLADRAFT_1049620 [Postia placenta MAD-698-R-SB12]